MSPKRGGASRDYPRSARLSELMREIAADTLERLDDERLGLLTVQAVEVDNDLNFATVYYAQSGVPDDDPEEFEDALERARRTIQKEIGRQAKIRSTPRVTLEADRVIETGDRIDEILRGLNSDG